MSLTVFHNSSLNGSYLKGHGKYKLTNVKISKLLID